MNVILPIIELKKENSTSLKRSLAGMDLMQIYFGNAL